MGRRFVVNVNTATPFEIDGLTWNILDMIGRLGSEEIIGALSQVHARDEIESALSELNRLRDEGELFTSPIVESKTTSGTDTPLGGAVMQISHECNLRCKYCYADHGKYGGLPAFMSREVAKRSIDFIIDNCGESSAPQVSFFGGEPLLNFPLMRHIVEYARSKENGKKLNFHVTTNGVLLNEEVCGFLSDNEFSMIVSFDGPETIHDGVRIFPSGRGSHRLVLQNIERVMKFPIWQNTTIRGTFSSANLDIRRQIDYLFDKGFTSVSVEPAIDDLDNPFALRTEHLPALERGYEEFTKSYLDRIRRGDVSRFFHFFNPLKLLWSGELQQDVCGAGTGYFAISSNGDLYPCYKLDGRREWRMGDVFDGIEKGKREIWRETRYVDSNDICNSCWAKYLCGGACRAYSILHAGDIMTPFPLTCELMKIRLKNVIWLYNELNEGLFQRLL